MGSGKLPGPDPAGPDSLRDHRGLPAVQRPANEPSFDLTQYAGKTATRYVYEIENYPNASDPVYATLLVYKDQVIGADITDTSANGVVQGLEMPG